MKRILFLAVVASAFTVSSCKKADNSTTTTPTTPNPYANIVVPTVQEAFIGDITATWCEYCGQWGIPDFEAQIAKAPARTNAISIHASSSDPLYTQAAQDIYNYYNSAAAPAKFNGWPNLLENWTNWQTNPIGWASAAENDATTSNTPACGIGLTQSIAGNTMTIMTRTKFFSDEAAGQYNIAIYITEDNIAQPQNIENAAGTAQNYDNSFIQHHVLRMSAGGTDYTGALLTNGAINANQEFDNTITANLTGTWVFKNLNVIAVVYRISNGMPVAVLNSHSLNHN